MKIIAVLAVIFAATATSSSQSSSFTRYQDCIALHGVSDETLIKFYRTEHKYNTGDIPALSKVTLCSYLQQDVLNQDGVYNKENFINNIVKTNTRLDEATAAKYTERAEICAPPAEATLEEKAFHISKCVVEATAYED